MARRKTRGSFAHRLLNLIAEPEFIRIEHILREPNFFAIVGRSHYERWHSAFFGWLLDPNGSHLLGDYALKRFLILLLDEGCRKAADHSEQFLIYTLPLTDFSHIEVTPNEYLHTETSVAGVGRFDIFLTADYTTASGDSKNLNIIFELKIDSKPNGRQSTKYADWLFQKHPNDINFLIFITPSLFKDSLATVGNAKWYCVDYQLLNDKFLLPLLDHPNLNEKVKPFVVQYIKNLKTRFRGIKMAITDEEKRLALALYEKYSDVFDSIYDALVATKTIDFSTSEVTGSKSRGAGRLAVRIDGKAITNETVRLLFEDVLKYIVNAGHILTLPLPWGTSKQRYILTNEIPATHPNGRVFFYPVECEGYTMESHYDRDRAMKVLSDLCDKLHIEFEPIET